jgi:hypothetical protein
VLFLAPGRVRCAVHGKPLNANLYGKSTILLSCHGNDHFRLDEPACSAFSARPVDEALVQIFTGQLTLDERDIRELARLAHQREQRDVALPGHLQMRLAEERARLERAKQLSMRAGDDDLAAEYLEEARKAKQTLRDLERELANVQAAQGPSARAWNVAEQAATLAERIRGTFAAWPRQAQMRVLVLALQQGILGRVNRYTFGLWLRWAGGAETRVVLAHKSGAFAAWTDEERAALHQYFGVLTWDAVQAMLPDRTPQAIRCEAHRLGLRRGAGPMLVTSTPAVFLAQRREMITMLAHGFTGNETASQRTEDVTTALSVPVLRAMERK